MCVDRERYTVGVRGQAVVRQLRADHRGEHVSTPVLQ